MNRHAHILALMSIAVAAFGVSVGSELRTTLIMAGLLAGAAVATVIYEARAQRANAVAGATAAKGSLLQTKRLLMLMMAIGIVVYGGGGAGTFSSFSAETTNTGSSVSSATLTMSDAVSSGQTCFSASSLSKDNVADVPAQQTINAQNSTTALGACDVALSLANVGPGVFAGSSEVTIANTGSLDASTLSMFAPYVNAATTSDVAANGSLSSLAVTPIEGPIKSGDTISLSYGSQSQTLYATADAGPLTQSISLSSTPSPVNTAPTASFAMPKGTRVLDTSTDGLNNSLAQENIDCFDVRNGTPGIANASAGTSLNFNNKANDHDVGGTEWTTDSTYTYTGPLCATTGFWVQEQSTVNNVTYNYCWYGDGAAGTTHVLTNGMCRAPISAAFSGSQTIVGGSAYSITPAAALRGNVKMGDSLVISEVGKQTAWCTATADAYIGTTTNALQFNACTSVPPNGSTALPSTTYTTAATITDGTTLTDLNTDTQTIANFDTLHGANNMFELPTLIANGSLAPSGATIGKVELGKKGAAGAIGVNPSAPDTRNFYIGAFLPSGTAAAQNAVQGLKSTFGIGWHIDQT